MTTSVTYEPFALGGHPQEKSGNFKHQGGSRQRASQSEVPGLRGWRLGVEAAQRATPQALRGCSSAGGYTPSCAGHAHQDAPGLGSHLLARANDEASTVSLSNGVSS